MGLAREATYTVATGEEAALLAGRFAATVALSPVPAVGAAARAAFEATTATPSERKFALTAEAEAELALLGGVGLKGSGAPALVESPPGTWFVEMEVEQGGKMGLALDPEFGQEPAPPSPGAEPEESMVSGLKVKGTVKAVLRVPVAAPTAEDLAAPSAWAKQAIARAQGATVELEVKSSVGRPGAAGEVKAKKEVPISQLRDAFSTDGWKVTGDVLIGPREESATIAVGEVEVTATRSFHVLTKETGSLEDLEKAKQAVDDANRARSGALRTGGR